MEKAKRVTIMIAFEVDKKLRAIQAKKITATQSSVSYSRTIDEILRKALNLK